MPDFTHLPRPVQDALMDDPPDYRKPLALARDWTRSGDPERVAWAKLLLDAATDPEEKKRPEWGDPNALPIWYERAFNRVKAGDADGALALLRDEIEPRFAAVLDPDTLSLWGRLHKDKGDAARREAEAVAGDPPRRAALFRRAAAEYEEAEWKYERSYLRHRDRFPGINVATLRLLRAVCLSLAADALEVDTLNREEADALRGQTVSLQDGSADRAQEVLNSRPWAKRLPDDDIWIAATEAEAHFLLRRWAEAEERYRFALHHDHKPQPHHADSMARQLERLNEAWKVLRVVVPPPFDNPREFLTDLLASKQRPTPETAK